MPERLNFLKISGFAALIMLFVGLQQGFAQNLEPFLLLEKPGTKKRFRYYKGDEIEFKRVDEKDFIKATIVQFSDTSFFVNDYIEVPLSMVSDVADRSRVEGVHKMAANTLLVIPVFFVFSAANNLFNTHDRPIIDEEVYYLSAAFAGLSGLGFLYKGRRYRLKNKWRIIVVWL